MTINDVEYTTGKLSAFQQLHVARRLAPVLAELFVSFKNNPEQLDAATNENPAGGFDILAIASIPLAETFAKMPEADVDYVVNTCLSVCQRKQAKGWAKVMKDNVLMFQDIELDTLIGLTSEVVQENLGRFFPTGQPESPIPAQ